jgi:hypothetical protein
MEAQFKTFDPTDISLVDVFVINSVIQTSTDLKVVDSTLPLHFDFHPQLNYSEDFAFVVIFFDIKLTVGDVPEPFEAHSGSKFRFDLRFNYKVKEIEKYLIKMSESHFDVSPELAFSLFSISFSTARGVLSSRLQNTVFSRLYLPLIQPADLLAYSNVKSRK